MSSYVQDCSMEKKQFTDTYLWWIELQFDVQLHFTKINSTSLLLLPIRQPPSALIIISNFLSTSSSTCRHLMHSSQLFLRINILLHFYEIYCTKDGHETNSFFSNNQSQRYNSLYYFLPYQHNDPFVSIQPENSFGKKRRIVPITRSNHFQNFWIIKCNNKIVVEQSWDDYYFNLSSKQHKVYNEL